MSNYKTAVMKKYKFLLVTLILLIAVNFCPISNKPVIACNTNAAACTVIPINKQHINIPAYLMDDPEITFDMFMNPFTHL